MSTRKKSKRLTPDMILRGNESVIVSLPMYDNMELEIRPLTLGEHDKILAITKGDSEIKPSNLMLEFCIVDPEITKVILTIKSGAVTFLTDQIYRISGFDDNIYDSKKK